MLLTGSRPDWYDGVSEEEVRLDERYRRVSQAADELANRTAATFTAGESE